MATESGNRDLPTENVLDLARRIIKDRRLLPMFDERTRLAEALLEAHKTIEEQDVSLARWGELHSDKYEHTHSNPDLESAVYSLRKRAEASEAKIENLMRENELLRKQYQDDGTSIKSWRERAELYAGLKNKAEAKLAEAEKALEVIAGPAQQVARSAIAREALAKIRGNDA